MLQARYEVTTRSDTVLTAVLGSCVAACLWDEEARVGGMNHFLLPGVEGEQPKELRYGVNSMELLINALLNAGARRSALQAKLFGGGQMAEGFAEVGRRNVEFATDFLFREGIVFRGGSLGGTAARKVEFWATSGRARQRAISDDGALFGAELRRTPAVAVESGVVDLFNLPRR